LEVAVSFTLASEWEESSEEWLIPSLLCDSLTLLSGVPKVGKTALAGHLIKSLVLQEEILGNKPVSGEFKVAWMGFDFKWRRELLTRLPELQNHLYFTSSVRFDDLSGWEALRENIIKYQVNFLVVDHLYGLSEGLDIDKGPQMISAFSTIKKLISETQIGALVLHQAPRNAKGRAAHSIAVEGVARWILELDGAGKTKTLKARGNGADSQQFKINLTPQELSLKAVADDKPAKPADGGLPERARFLLENAPTDIETRKSARALGKWLSEQGVGVDKSESGRSAVNDLLKAGLLMRRVNKGEITAGPKLVI
jgi:hypothetical protein